MTGKELRKLGVEILRAAGWVVKFMDHHKRTPTGMKGFVDIIAIRNNVCLLIEIKGEFDRFRQSQVDYALAIDGHLGPNVVYGVVSRVEQFEAYL